MVLTQIKGSRAASWSYRNSPRNGCFSLVPMKSPRSESEREDKPVPKPSRVDEAFQVIAEYASELREILRKLRGRLH